MSIPWPFKRRVKLPTLTADESSKPQPGATKTVDGFLFCYMSYRDLYGETGRYCWQHATEEQVAFYRHCLKSNAALIKANHK